MGPGKNLNCVELTEKKKSGISPKVMNESGRKHSGRLGPLISLWKESVKFQSISPFPVPKLFSLRILPETIYTQYSGKRDKVLLIADSMGRSVVLKEATNTLN